ncbi:hypothetical protein ACJX0J_007215, partial [Zea mays]
DIPFQLLNLFAVNLLNLSAVARLNLYRLNLLPYSISHDLKKSFLTNLLFLFLLQTVNYAYAIMCMSFYMDANEIRRSLIIKAFINFFGTCLSLFLTISNTTENSQATGLGQTLSDAIKQIQWYGSLGTSRLIFLIDASKKQISLKLVSETFQYFYDGW